MSSPFGLADLVPWFPSQTRNNPTDPAELAKLRASRDMLLALQKKAPICVAYGMGVDSTALLIGLWIIGVRPDLITFADVGSELPETYAYLPIIQAWLKEVGFPPVVVVRYDGGNHKRYYTLEENCLANGVLPGLAVGNKSCSIKFKREVQDAYREDWAPAQAAWAKKLGGTITVIDGKGKEHTYPRTQLVTVLIGYDNGANDGRRSQIADDHRYHYVYPLREWDWDRPKCKAEIASTGLPVPMKSSCWFCPSLQPSELIRIVNKYPEIADRIIAIEAAARPKDKARRAAGKTAAWGLWRSGTKGMRGAIPKPAAMTTLIREIRGLPRDPSIPLPPNQDPNRKYLPVLREMGADVCSDKSDDRNCGGGM